MSTPLKAARRIVLKIGSSLLVDPATGLVNGGWLKALTADLADLTRVGKEVIVVSSGAVALGRQRLGLSRRRSTLPEKQAAAAAGQSILMHAWESALEVHGLKCAQILLTRDDTEMRRRWLNGRATLETLIDLGVVPVINENDSVATEEIRYGDNDRLAARVAQMVSADLLILLSDIDGLYSADPRSNPDAQHIPVVHDLTPDIMGMAGGSNLQVGVGTGGMATKLIAAKIAQDAGCSTLISLGNREFPLKAIENGARSTQIMPLLNPKAAYKAWIAGSLNPAGKLLIDAGAAAALQRGKSLLAAGITGVEGIFGQGDAVQIIGPEAQLVATGLARYDSSDAARIVGYKIAAIERALGYSEGPVVHADDLALEPF